MRDGGGITGSFEDLLLVDEQPDRRHTHDPAAAFAVILGALGRNHVRRGPQSAQTGVAGRAEGVQLGAFEQPAIGADLEA